MPLYFYQFIIFIFINHTLYTSPLSRLDFIFTSALWEINWVYFHLFRRPFRHPKMELNHSESVLLRAESVLLRTQSVFYEQRVSIYEQRVSCYGVSVLL